MGSEYFKRVTYLLLDGWDVEAASLYDEDGVEGWKWTHHTNFNEFYETGLWDELPALPEELEQIADSLINKVNCNT